MADTGWVFPGTTASYVNLATSTQRFDDNVGSPSYPPDNVKKDDIRYVNSVGPKFNNGDSPNNGIELVVTNFGFSIPSDQVITGVEAEIKGVTDTNRVGEFAYLTDSTGSPPSGFIGTAKEDEWTDMPTGNYQGSPKDDFAGIHVYGGQRDTWGADLTPAIVNSSSFGWVFMIYDDLAPLNCAVWYMKMKVHYRKRQPIIVTVGI